MKKLPSPFQGVLRRCLLGVAAVSLVFASNIGVAAPLTVQSPDKNIQVEIDQKGEGLFYTVRYKKQALINASRLGMALSVNGQASGPSKLVSHQFSQFDQTWTQPWGEVKEIRNQYQELTLHLQSQLAAQVVKTNLVFRVFNDGIGFRYEWPKQEHLQQFNVTADATEFAFAGNYKTWSIPAYEIAHFEYLYKEAPVSSLNVVHTPMTLETDNGTVVALHEAALVDFPAMALRGNGSKTLQAELIRAHDGIPAKLSAPHQSSWRTIQIAASAKELPTSYLMLNLNEPNKLGDVSWVKPAKYVGVWWEIHLDRGTWSDDGPRHAANTANVMKYIDFAADNGFKGVLVEGWNKSWNMDWTKEGYRFSFTQPTDDFDIAKLSEYGAKRGVKIIGHHETAGWIQNYEKQLPAALDFYKKYGVDTIKTGYVDFFGANFFDANGKEYKEPQDGQLMVNHFQHVIDEAAKRHISIVAHEAIKDTGLRRTYPNFLSREGARGQEYNAWSNDGGNPPEHDVLLPFTRLLAAPMDFTPGIFKLTYEDRPTHRVNTTIAKQLALYVTLYSPVQMAADLPENYLAKPDAFQFIKDVPVDWEFSKVLHAQIGDYLTFVRKDRHSSDWYLGSITDEQARSLPTDFSFLDKNKTWVADIYRDADDADWKTNPHAITIEHVLVKSTTKYVIKLAAGGGQAIRFRPATEDDLKKWSWK